MREDVSDDAVSSGDAGAPAEERRQRTVGTRRAVMSIKKQHRAERTAMERFADSLTRAAGSSAFFVGHVVWFAVWVAWNVGALGLRPFDPYPFGLLTMVVSLEAIFLSIFVLMAQRRESAIAELREEITLQVLLRSEEEITKALQLVAGLYGRLGHRVAEDPELAEMIRPLDAAAIERQLRREMEETREMRAAARGIALKRIVKRGACSTATSGSAGCVPFTAAAKSRTRRKGGASRKATRSRRPSVRQAPVAMRKVPP
jgi:uncharacterized membrane protein